VAEVADVFGFEEEEGAFRNGDGLRIRDEEHEVSASFVCGELDFAPMVAGQGRTWLLRRWHSRFRREVTEEHFASCHLHSRRTA
jgi:hypothetical protein